ncbi:MAG TPA: DnaT-like ssDNA-binding protein [Quisquiliibacterium sp.]|nr:DnaT-like ssDNA-binding protein [Quisquiliibacterium sp.]
MTIIVETGAALTDAESYITVADADTYHAARGNTAWASLSTGSKEAALRKATDYMTGAYQGRWKGERATSAQALDWPRTGAVANGYEVASDAVPAAVARACAELALRASAADLSPDLERGVRRERVDVIETEYDTTSPQATRYRAVDQLLAAYLTGGGAFVRVERV